MVYSFLFIKMIIISTRYNNTLELALSDKNDYHFHDKTAWYFMFIIEISSKKINILSINDA